MVKFKRDKETETAIKSFVKKNSSRASSKKEREIIRKAKLAMEKEKKKEIDRIKKERKELIKRAKGRTKKLFRTEGRKAIKKREAAAKGLLGAAGIISSSRYSGAGRPRGTYKYGMPIHIYKQKLREKKALYAKYKQEQALRLGSRGFTPEQVQQLEQQQTINEIQQPTQEYEEMEEYQEMPEQYEQQPQIQTQMVQNRRRMPYGRVIPRSQQVQPGRSIADDELEFRQWSAEKTISPRTQRILDRIRRIQNKGKRDNIERQRVNRERAMASRMMNLLKAHENMINVDMDFTGVKEDNPLLAPNVWKQREDNNIMRTNRRNILDMQENNLKFF